MGDVIIFRPPPCPAPARVSVCPDGLLRSYAGFPDLWSAFLRAHFRSPVDAASFFGVTERAARKWWEGVGGVTGARVVVALATIPTAQGWLVAERAVVAAPVASRSGVRTRAQAPGYASGDRLRG